VETNIRKNWSVVSPVGGDFFFVLQRIRGRFTFYFIGGWSLHYGGATLMPTRTNSTAYRSAIGVAIAAAFILVWLSLGVGIIGKDGDPANLVYFGVLAVGIIDTIIVRLQPMGWHAHSWRRRWLGRWWPSAPSKGSQTRR
jgi:hypothetical protein